MEKQYSLIIDVGNSTTVFGLFHGDNFVASLTTSTHLDDAATKKDKLQTFLNDFDDAKVVDGMLFSVAPSMNKSIIKIVKKLLKFDMPVFDWENYEYKAKDPGITDKIGADLLADLVGAVHLHGYPTMVIDLGTVNKLLLIDEKGIFVGASFNPGMEISLNLFNQKTALLPSINKVGKMSEKTGFSTIESMCHGVYWETVSFINHEHKSQEELYKMPIKLVLTGGNAEVVHQDIDNKVYDPLLTLKGMNILFKETQK